MYKVISQCPVCGGRLKVIKLKCDKCDTVIENDFRLNKFDYLSEQELFFIETFIRCRGTVSYTHLWGIHFYENSIYFNTFQKGDFSDCITGFYLREDGSIGEKIALEDSV